MEEEIDLLLRHVDAVAATAVPQPAASAVPASEPAAPGGLSEEVRRLARDPAMKIYAIKRHREQTGLGLKEAKDAVEAFIASGR